MPNPLLFISHKHTDRAIARVIADFITDQSRGEVDVFLSSDSSFEKPKVGLGLNAQLRQTLWRTDALILVYTSADDQDWSYCMWECGAAAAPNSPETNIFVFKCWRDVPKPFDDKVIVDARDLTSLQNFTGQLLKDPTFFPRRGEALAPQVKPETVEKEAKKLLTALNGVLPDLDDGATQQWSAWPLLRIELPVEVVDTIEAAPEDERGALAREVVTEHGVALDGGERTAELFGLANLAPRHAVKELLRTWGERSQGAQPKWFSSCCDQIAAAALRRFIGIRPATLKSANGDAEFTPVLSRARRLPSAKVIQFDIYFYNLNDLRAIPVTSRMLPAEDVYMKTIGPNGPGAFKLGALLDELEALGKSRVPLVDAQMRPLYIVHSSMIDKYMLKRSRAGASREEVNNLTLDDLLAEPGMKQMFETTFAVVSAQATLADVRQAMANLTDVRDVFVTAEGARDEPILGWLTNVDLVTKR